MITMRQELIPLSDKMCEAPISKDSSYTNPVIIPFVLDATGNENIMETVIYIRNDSQQHYYEDIVVSLMKEDSGSPEVVDGILSVAASGCLFSLNAASGSNSIPVEEAYLYAQAASGVKTLQSKYKSTYIPVVNDGKVSVKFSFGSEELSYSEWETKKSILAIPNIGTSGEPNTSYIPIRMRLKWAGMPSIFTIRDYFIDVSYATEVVL